jgi:hypothetical protein
MILPYCPPQKLREKKTSAIWVDDQGFTLNEEMQRFFNRNVGNLSSVTIFFPQT